jgi:TIR domain-containing protein
MLVILYQDAWRGTAERIAADLAAAYAGRLEVTLMPGSSPTSWEAEPSWDDLLLVLFDRGQFPDAGQQFIEAHQTRSAQTRMILPVAIEREHQRPPRSVAEIKALDFDSTASGSSGRLVRRVGAMLGLRVQSRDNQIFISYRTADGSAIAVQLYDHLRSLGYLPWRDEAREFDGEPQILPGSPVQQAIDEALSKANLVLLIDTPSAPHSPWIKHEVDTANSLLLPILPICFRDANDPKKGPRFRSLLDLQRWAELKNPGSSQELPLNPDELNHIVSEMETYLSEIFRRKCRVPFLVEKEFVSRHFAWRVLDQRLLMFESTKQQSWRVSTKVLSHCSVFEQVHTASLKKLAEYFERTERANHALFIYDGELIPEPELKEIAETHGGPAIILHHQELATLIDSNFTTLAA